VVVVECVLVCGGVGGGGGGGGGGELLTATTGGGGGGAGWGGVLGREAARDDRAVFGRGEESDESAFAGGDSLFAADGVSTSSGSLPAQEELASSTASTGSATFSSACPSSSPATGTTRAGRSSGGGPWVPLLSPARPRSAAAPACDGASSVAALETIASAARSMPLTASRDGPLRSGNASATSSAVRTANAPPQAMILRPRGPRAASAPRSKPARTGSATARTGSATAAEMELQLQRFDSPRDASRSRSGHSCSLTFQPPVDP
jgi:type IV secretion system protein TrbL